MSDEIETQTTALTKLTESANVSSCITDAEWVKSKAKKNLLQSFPGKTYSDATLELHRIGAHAKLLHTELRIDTPFDQMNRAGRAISETAFLDAKKLINIIAHVNVICNYTGKEQVEAASSLLARQQNVPNCLTAELTVISNKKIQQGKKRKGPEDG